MCLLLKFFCICPFIFIYIIRKVKECVLARIEGVFMTDFSVRKSSVSKDVKLKSAEKSDFKKMKSEYLAMKKKADKSDFANSPVMLTSELEMLGKLKKLAKLEKADSELSWIEEREAVIRKALKGHKQNIVCSSYYNPVVNFGRKEDSQDSAGSVDFEQLMELCKKSDGTFDTNAEAMLNSLGKKNVDLPAVIEIIRKSKGDGNDIIPSYAQAIVKLVDSGVKKADLFSYTEAFTTGEDGSIDLESLDNALDFTVKGMSSKDSIKLASLLNENFTDKSQIKTAMMKLHKASVSPETINSLIEMLALEDIVTGQKTVSKKAVDQVLNLKKLLLSTRKNEDNERQNPINMLDVNVFTFGDNTMVMKNGKITYLTPVEGEDYELSKERYDSMVAAIEDSMLLDFVSRYKDSNGEIDSKYLRIAMVLRNSGIVYNQVLDMIDSCINSEGNIDKERLEAIISVKKAGALCDDIHGILDACERMPDGKYNEDDLQTVCDLTSAVIGGKEVCSLLPEVRGNGGLKEFVLLSSPAFSEKSNLLKLISIMKGKNSSVEENALDVMNDMVYNFLGNTEKLMPEKEFVSQASEIINLARGKCGIITDDAAGICAIMCENGESAENIKSALKLCSDTSGEIDEKLAEILWDMSVQHASYAEIQDAISICKNADKSINYSNADMILSLLEAGYSKDKILSFVIGHN